MVGISRPVVKHSFLVKQTEDIPGIFKESLLAGGQRPTGAGSGRFAEGYSQSGEKKLPYVWPDAVSMRSYNPTTSGHKGQIKRALQTLVAAKKTGRIRRWRGDQFAVRSTAAYAGRKAEATGGLFINGFRRFSGDSSAGAGDVGDARYL